MKLNRIFDDQNLAVVRSTKCTILLLCLFIPLALLAQENDHDHDDPDHVHHEHHRHEIGVANSPVYFIKEKELSYGLHAHYIYHFDNSKFWNRHRV